MTDFATSVLVIEGGGLRGAFSAGVLSELARLGGPRFSDVVAVSSGAPSAAYYAVGQIDDAVTIWREHTHSGQLVAMRNALRGRPILDVDRLIEVFQRRVRLDHTALARSLVRVHVGVTDCASGEARYLSATPDNVFELLRATMALPVAYGKVVRLAECMAVDGGVAAPIGLQYALSLGAKRTLVVLTRPRGYRRRSGWLADRVIGWSYPQHGGIRHAMRDHTQRANVTSSMIETLEDRGEIGVIRPERDLPARRLSSDPARIHATIACGERAARAWVGRNPDW